jgi:translation elongation factor P/translation initiation factor 5A
MIKKSALQKIEAHEKLCRIMQKQTFEQIKELKDKINRIEKILLGTAAFIIVSLIEKVI